jgi:diguanylate cyclase (GGDEF)-like protein
LPNDDAQARASALLALVREWPRYERDREAAFAAITETASNTVGVPRASIWLRTEHRDGMVLADLFRRGHPVHEHGAVLLARDYPAYFDALEREETVATSDARTDPRTRDLWKGYLEPHGIAAMLDAPIRVGGRLVGVVCHEHVGAPRQFTQLECAHAALLASLASLSLELGDRSSQEIVVREAHEIERAILEASSEGIIATDEHGRILAHNGRFLAMWGVEDAWLEHSSRDERLQVLASRTRDPEAFQRGVLELNEGNQPDVPTEIALIDGRVLERVSRPLDLHGRKGRVFAYRDVTDERRVMESLRANELRLAELATHDSLTGLLNRRALLEALEAAAPRGNRREGDRSIAVLMIDLDHFKRVNDEHGHAAGDAVLRDFGEVLRARLRRGDVAGRYGGEEFVVVAEVRDRTAARALAEEIRARAASGASGIVPYRVSIGVALGPDDAAAPDALLRVADERLYEAKRTGRDRVVG